MLYPKQNIPIREEVLRANGVVYMRGSKSLSPPTSLSFLGTTHSSTARSSAAA
jgi:hypothetical protein